MERYIKTFINKVSDGEQKINKINHQIIKYKKNIEIIKLLDEHKCEFEESDAKTLFNESGCLLEKLVLLTRKYPKLDKFLASYFKTHNIDYMRKGYTIFHKALTNTVSGCSGKTIKIMLDAKPNLSLKTNSDGFTPLMILLINSNKNTEETFTILINYIFTLENPYSYLNDQSKTGLTPLHYAILHSNNYAIKTLLNLKVDLEVLSNNGNNVLNMCLLGSPTNKEQNLTIEMLINAGANINTQNKKNNTPLHNAIIDLMNQFTFVREEIVSILMNSKEINLNLQNCDGNTPLHLIAMDNRLQCIGSIIEQMLEKSVDLNIQNNLGLTPLHCLAQKKSYYLMRKLVNAGADIKITDKQNKPIQCYVPKDVFTILSMPINIIKKCLICYFKTNVIKCPSNHAICDSCIFKLMKENKIVCSYCTQKYQITN